MMAVRVDGYDQGYAAVEIDPGRVSTAAMSATTPSADAAAGSRLPLPDPLQSLASGGDLLAELTALLTLASRSDRDAARAAERADDTLRTQQERLKVQQMHEQADDIRAGAW